MDVESRPCPVAKAHLRSDKGEARSTYPEVEPHENSSVQGLFYNDEPWPDLEEDLPDNETIEFSGEEEFISEDLVTNLDTQESISRNNGFGSSNKGCVPSINDCRPELSNNDTIYSHCSSNSSFSDLDFDLSSASNSNPSSSITTPDSDSLLPVQHQNIIPSLLHRWSQSLAAEYALISALSTWLLHDISISISIPTLLNTTHTKICNITPSSCPNCLHSLIEQHPQWSFLLPVLSESTIRIETATFWVCMLQNAWHSVEMPDHLGESFWGLDSIPEPPDQQLVTPELEEKISGAEERFRRKKRRDRAANSSC